MSDKIQEIRGAIQRGDTIPTWTVFMLEQYDALRGELDSANEYIANLEQNAPLEAMRTMAAWLRESRAERDRLREAMPRFIAFVEFSLSYSNQPFYVDECPFTKQGAREAICQVRAVLAAGKEPSDG